MSKNNIRGGLKKQLLSCIIPMEIELYKDHRNRFPVNDYIQSLSDPVDLSRIAKYMQELKSQGYRIQRPFAAPLRNGIYELRPGHHRILYGFVRGTVVLLHAFRKTRREVPDRDIELAVRRLEVWIRKEKE